MEFRFAPVKPQSKRIQISKISDGFGFGNGSISFFDHGYASGKARIKVESAFTTQNLLTPISPAPVGGLLDDDGCGDGRAWNRIFHGDREHYKSLTRPKVFGGGATMAAAGLIANSASIPDSLSGLYSSAMAHLRRREIDYGAHSDVNYKSGLSGCGAIDNAPAILRSIPTCRDQISSIVQSLGHDNRQIDEVLDKYSKYNQAVDTSGYQGERVLNAISKDLKVIKRLDKMHAEKYIFINQITGFTIDQHRIREISKGCAQVFVVDDWRLKSIAQRMFSTPSARVRAYISELVYTIATAATLTKGDLPVYIVSEENNVNF